MKLKSCIPEEESEFVKQIRAIRRRKRIIIKSTPKTPSKIIRNGRDLVNSSRNSILEVIPQDILIRILCRVDHDDLKQLIHVSKSIKEASLIAKRVHFAFNTPSKTVAGLRCFSDLEDGSDEAPNAPKQERNGYISRFDEKKIADISVALFRSPEKKKKQWRRNLFVIETKI